MVYVFEFFPNNFFKIVYLLNSLASPHPGYDFDKLKSYFIRPPGRVVLKRKSIFHRVGLPIYIYKYISIFGHVLKPNIEIITGSFQLNKLNSF